jgi:hypothetical protein
MQPTGESSNGKSLPRIWVRFPKIKVIGYRVRVYGFLGMVKHRCWTLQCFDEGGQGVETAQSLARRGLELLDVVA